MNNSEVYQYVDHYREEAISFLQEMLQTPSSTGEELAVEGLKNLKATAETV